MAQCVEFYYTYKKQVKIGRNGTLTFGDVDTSDDKSVQEEVEVDIKVIPFPSPAAESLGWGWVQGEPSRTDGVPGGRERQAASLRTASCCCPGLGTGRGPLGPPLCWPVTKSSYPVLIQKLGGVSHSICTRINLLSPHSRPLTLLPKLEPFSHHLLEFCCICILSYVAITVSGISTYHLC